MGRVCCPWVVLSVLFPDWEALFLAGQFGRQVVFVTRLTIILNSRPLPLLELMICQGLDISNRGPYGGALYKRSALQVNQ